ncbi:MAG: acyl-CoA thioesterase [Rickettsiales bacterium]|jgi:acyl-CoA thioester hydrolase|nr:acyl-CoA thioesterase [Rickettsiales bacterium]
MDIKANFGTIRDGVHRFPAHVYYNHTDAGGIMYYANYLRVAEEARCAQFRLLGITGGPERGDFVVRSCRAEYIRSARLGDDLVVESKYVKVGRASADIVQKFYNEGELITQIEIKVVFVSLKGVPTPVPIPPEIREKLK